MNDIQDIVLYTPRKKQPVVVVTKDGITYDPPGWSIFKFNASILWSQITAIYPGEFVKQRHGVNVMYPYLAIIPQDMLSFLESAYPPLKRRMVMYTLQSFGGPMTIAENFLPISVEDLFLQISTQFHCKIDAYGIRTEKGSL
jgi:hypothetical protein